MKALYEKLYKAFEDADIKKFTVYLDEDTIKDVNSLNSMEEKQEKYPGYDVIKPRKYEYPIRKVDFKVLSHFVGMKGKHYDEQKIKLLLVGRAVNGWGAVGADNSKEFAENIENLFENNHFDWVYDNGGALYNKITEDGIEKAGSYSLSKPFWGYSREVWEKLHGKVPDPRWVDYIAWTNLYKIAPTYKDNPDNDMKKIQGSICVDILREEIERFKPTHILFVTDMYWMNEYGAEYPDFLDLISDGIDLRNGENSGEYAQLKGVYRGIFGEAKVVISGRPEFKSKECFVNSVVNAFGEALK